MLVAALVLLAVALPLRHPTLTSVVALAVIVVALGSLVGSVWAVAALALAVLVAVVAGKVAL